MELEANYLIFTWHAWPPLALWYGISRRWNPILIQWILVLVHAWFAAYTMDGVPAPSHEFGGLTNGFLTLQANLPGTPPVGVLSRLDTGTGQYGPNGKLKYHKYFFKLRPPLPPQTPSGTKA